jgi:hypothetical protein
MIYKKAKDLIGILDGILPTEKRLEYLLFKVGIIFP